MSADSTQPGRTFWKQKPRPHVRSRSHTVHWFDGLEATGLCNVHSNSLQQVIQYTVPAVCWSFRTAETRYVTLTVTPGRHFPPTNYRWIAPCHTPAITCASRQWKWRQSKCHRTRGIITVSDDILRWHFLSPPSPILLQCHFSSGWRCRRSVTRGKSRKTKGYYLSRPWGDWMPALVPRPLSLFPSIHHPRFNEIKQKSLIH